MPSPDCPIAFFPAILGRTAANAWAGGKRIDNLLFSGETPLRALTPPFRHWFALAKPVRPNKSDQTALT